MQRFFYKEETEDGRADSPPASYGRCGLLSAVVTPVNIFLSLDLPFSFRPMLTCAGRPCSYFFMTAGGLVKKSFLSTTSFFSLFPLSDRMASCPRTLCSSPEDVPLRQDGLSSYTRVLLLLVYLQLVSICICIYAYKHVYRHLYVYTSVDIQVCTCLQSGGLGCVHSREEALVLLKSKFYQSSQERSVRTPSRTGQVSMKSSCVWRLPRRDRSCHASTDRTKLFFT